MSSSIKDDRVHRSTTASCSLYHCRQQHYVAHRVPPHNSDETLLYSWGGGLNAADVEDDIMMRCKRRSLCQMSAGGDVSSCLKYFAFLRALTFWFCKFACKYKYAFQAGARFWLVVIRWTWTERANLSASCTRNTRRAGLHKQSLCKV